MDFNLTTDQRALRDEIRRFASAELNHDLLDRDESAEFSMDAWHKCGEMRLTGLPVPEQFGGPGLDGAAAAVALEAFGFGCEDGGLAFSVCAHLLACVVPVWKSGSEVLKERYLAAMAAGERIATNAMTEPSGGSDAFAMAARAVRDSGGFRITGQKTMCTNAPVAHLAVTYAVTDPEKGPHGGITGFLVELDSPGVRIGQKFSKMGLRTSTMGEVIFEDAFVPDANVIGQPGGGSMIFNQSMEWERTCIAAVHVGTMERLLLRTIAYARERKSAGRPIGKYQSISHKIADMKARLETSRLLVYQTASKLDRSRTVSMDASLTKFYVSDCLVRNAQEAIQIFGGYGYLTETGIERALRDSIGGAIYSGTNEVQRNIVATWLGL